MKKRYIIFIVALILFLLGCNETKHKESTYRVVASFDYAPFIYRDDETREKKGFIYEVVKEIEKRGAFKFEWYDQPFPRILDRVIEGRYDIGVSAFTITAERKKVVDFTEPLCSSEIVVLGNKEIEYGKTEDTIYGIQTNSAFDDKIIKKIGNKVIVSSKEERLVSILVGKEIDYLITDLGAGDRLIKENPQLFKKEVLENSEVAIVVSKKLDKDDLKRINEIILEMKSDGTIENLKKKYDI